MSGFDAANRQNMPDWNLEDRKKLQLSREEGVILVADDDLHIRRILVLFLNNAGYKCIEANNGRQVLELCAKHRVKAIFLDVVMPGMDGFLVCRELKSNPSTRTIPVILCTALRQKDSVLTALQVGADDYIVKPFKREIVLQKLEKVLVKKTPMPTVTQPTVERRRSPRRQVSFQLSWSPPGRRAQVIYKTRVINICYHGLCFELDACEHCTGYLASSVHEKCQLFPYALVNRQAADIEMFLSDNGNNTYKVKGKIAHIYRPPHVNAEYVGVFFTHVPAEAATHIVKLVGH